MAEYAVVINYQLKDEQSTSIILDSVDDVDINKSSTITSQPMVNGDEISDHIYKSGISMTISGSCSMNGNQGFVINSNESKLTNFEQLFERIQKEGVRCAIFKIKVGTDNSVRFLHRENMVLQNIRFNEQINSLGFTLTFKQILVTDVIEYDVAIDDEYLPNVTEPKTLSFTESLIDYDKIDASICQLLEKEGLLTSGFKNFLTGLSGPALQSLLLGAAGATIAAVLVALNTTPIGWVITAGLLIAGAVVIMWKGIIDAFNEAKRRRKYAIETFKFYNNPSKDAEELERFADFISSIHNEFNALNNALHVYQISSNEPQEAMVSIYNDYYIFTFTKNNTTNKYSLQLSNVDKSMTKEIPDITTSPTNFYELTSANYLIKTNQNQRIYLILNGEDKSDLTNYFILVSDINPSDFNAMITKIINSKIFRNA